MPNAKQTGYYVQRNAENFAYFALANYIQAAIGHYPFLPIVMEYDVEEPRGAGPRPAATDPAIIFNDQGEQPAVLVDFFPATVGDTGCPVAAAAEASNSEDDFEVGKQIPATSYPSSYLEKRQKWIALLRAENPAAPPSADPAPPSAPAHDENQCRGIRCDVWVMSRDIAVENVNAFCAQREKKVRYNQGSVNELELSVWKVTDDAAGPADAPDCVGRLRDAVIDVCDGDEPVNNPHNYKFGATLTTADGWAYKLEPLSKQVNEVSCDVSYKFISNAIEIRGRDLPDAKLGANGESLRDNLSGCGSLHEWKFERAPDDVNFQWYASCRLPIGTKNCVGSALQAVGGSSTGNCHGAGRRLRRGQQRGNRAIGIDNWPGYGDDSRHVFEDEQKRNIGIEDWPDYGDDSKHTFGH